MAGVFNFFSSDKNKKNSGLTKSEVKVDRNYGIAYFFKVYKINFGKLTALNFIYILMVLPFVFIIISNLFDLDGTVKTSSNVIYPLIYGASNYEDTTSPAITLLMSIFGTSTTLSVEGPLTQTFYYFGFVTILTFGFANTGLAYVLRNITKRKPCMVWHDFFYTIKKNWKQALILGIIDSLLILLCAYDLVVYPANNANMLYNMFFYIVLMFSIIYFFARFYMYIIMVTFDLSITKILKNSFIFAILGFKRNITALIGIGITLLLTYFMFLFLPTAGLFVPIIWTVATASFIGIYCAYPIMFKIMIKPYYPDEDSDKPNIEPIFLDRG